MYGLGGIEEGVVEKVPDGACALALALNKGQNVEVKRLDSELAALLSKEGAATNLCHHVTTAVDSFFILFYIAIFGKVLAPESFVAG